MSEFVYPPVIAIARLMFWVLRLRLRIEGAQNFPRTGGAVLASNHVSYLDFIFAGLAARPSRRLVRFMAKREVFDHRISGPLMRGMHHIPVDRNAGAASYRDALRALRAGEVVGVFPEATISRSFTVKEIKSGAVRMAASADVPLVPVVVWGSQRLWTKGHRRTLFRRRTPISILVGEPLYPKRKADFDEITAQLHTRLSDLLDRAQREYPDAPTGPEDTWWQPAHLGGSAPSPADAAALDEEPPASDTGAARQ